MQIELVGLRTIETTESLLPFDEQDAVGMIDWANETRQQGIGIFLSKSAAEDRDFKSWMDAGLIVLRSPMLDIEILLAKAEGMEKAPGQSRVYRMFIGDYPTDQWGEGATFSSLESGLNAIADVCTSAPVIDQNSSPVIQLYG